MPRHFRMMSILVIALLLGQFALAQTTAEKEKSEKAGSKKAESKSKDQSDASIEEQDEEQLPQVLELRLAGSYVDLVQPISFDPLSLAMGAGPAKQKSFYKLCEFLEDLEDNEDVRYVVLNLSAGNLSMNSAQLDELSRRMKQLQASGKETFAWLENASNVHLSVAAMCDEIVMADFGGIDMPSAAMQSMFYRDAMDLIGVKASVVRAGNFKGAVEPYVNPQMSEHLREHYLEMLSSINDARVDAVAKGRGLKPQEVRDLQKKRMILPKQAVSAGLVDRLGPYGSMVKSIEKSIDEDVEWTTPKKKKKRKVSFFELVGQLMAGPSSSKKVKDESIAILHLSGTIIDGTKASGGNMVSGPTVKQIEKLIDEDKIKGVVVRINSPGGSATASEAIRQALVKLTKAKPTVISMGNVAASGGYWITCIDAPVYAERGTITGSIGVFSMKLSLGSLMRRIGVHLESISLDEAANAFAMDRPWSDQEVGMVQESIDMVYDKFLRLASKARGIDIDRLQDLAGGRVWSGEQAKRLKLVDSIGGVDDCLAVVARKSDLDEYNVIHRPVTSSGLDLSDLLSQGGDEEIWHRLPATAVKLLERRGFDLNTTRTIIQDNMSNRGQRPTIWLLNPMEFSVR